MNIRNLPSDVLRVPFGGNVLFLRPRTGEITEEEIPLDEGLNATGTTISLVSIPKWCRTCHPKPTVVSSRSGATFHPRLGEDLEHVCHFDKKKGHYVTDGYYCGGCKKLYTDSRRE